MIDSTALEAGSLSRRAALTLGLGVGAAALVGLAPASAATRTVNYSYQRQATQSWCSAASSRIALSARGVRPSQSSLAAQLGLRGGSGLQDPTLIAQVLNRNLGRAGKISDPDEPARSGAWFSDDNIVAWNKLNRFTAFA